MKTTRTANATPATADLVDALAPLVALLAPLVAAQLGHKASNVITSAMFKRGDDPDCDVSVGTFHRACQRGEVEGARKRGRSWECPRDAWRAYRHREGARAARRRVVEPPVEVAPVVDAESALLAELGARRSA